MLQSAFYVGGLAGIGFWLWTSRVMEKHRLYLVAAITTAVLMLASLMLFGEGRLFGTGNPLPLTVGNALAGFCASILWFVPASMIADVADEDELVTGRRREGLFFGVFYFGQQLAAGMSSLLAGVLLDWFADLAPGQVEQSALTAHRIAILYSVVPAALVLTAGFVSFRYDLGRSRVAEIQTELARRRSGEAARCRQPAETWRREPVWRGDR